MYIICNIHHRESFVKFLYEDIRIKFFIFAIDFSVVMW